MDLQEFQAGGRDEEPTVLRRLGRSKYVKSEL